MSFSQSFEQFIPREERTWNRLAVSLGMFILGTIFASWASRIPDIKHFLNLSDAQLGFALFAAPIGQIPSMLVTPMLVKRFGSCSIMAKFHGCWSLGGVIGGLFGGMMAGLGVSPRWHFVCILLLAFASANFAWRRLMKTDPLPNVAHTGLTRHRWMKPDILLVILGIIGFGSMAVEGSMYDWNSVYFVSVLHEEGFSARLGYLVCMIAMVSARFIADGFINRYGEVFVLRVSSVSMTIGLAMLVAFPTLIPAMIGSAFVGFGMAAVVPICFSMAGRSTLVSASTAISMVTAISFLGFLMGPPVIGTMSEHIGLRGAFAVVMGAPIIVVLLSAKMKKIAPKKH